SPPVASRGAGGDTKGMNPDEIRITAEPIDTARCKFLVSQPLHTAGVRRFSSPEEAKGSPLAEAIFAIPGAAVAELIVSGNLVTVVKGGVDITDHSAGTDPYFAAAKK